MTKFLDIAVTLSLIVALTAQPIFAYAFRGYCSIDCGSERSCSGCGCCQIQSAGETCSCCNKSEPEKNDEQAVGCCSSHKREEDEDRRTEQESAAAASHIAACLGLPGREVSLVEEVDAVNGSRPQPGIQAAEQSIASACNCATRPNPVDAPVPRTVLNELRDIFASSMELGGVFCLVERSLPVSRLRTIEVAVSPHFSQISLCVWRL